MINADKLRQMIRELECEEEELRYRARKTEYQSTKDEYNELGGKCLNAAAALTVLLVKRSCS